MVWIPLVLWADTGASLQGQVWLGLLSTALLLVLLRRESALVRVQTLVVVVFATVVEYVFSGYFEVYVYRLEHVPAYVPVGHGLVYLAALAFGRMAFVNQSISVLAPVLAAASCAIGLAGAFGAFGRPDALGAFWALCLAGFLLWGPNPGLYVGALIVVTYLEVIGTHWGVWTWASVDTIAGWVPMGNPPSIAAGGYGWFDLVATVTAPAILAWYYRLRMSKTSECSTPLVVTAHPEPYASEPS